MQAREPPPGAKRAVELQAVEWADIRDRRARVDRRLGATRQRLRPESLDAFREPESGDVPRFRLTAAEFFGVALSGGGIRSASTCLGALQALHRHGVLPHVDYLSTVSGGGFMGASLSAMTRAPVAGEDPAPFPFSRDEGGAESPALVHLRNNSKYLSTRGALDYLRALAVTLAGLTANALLLLPLPMLFAVGLSIAYGDFLRRWDAAPDAYTTASVYVVTPWAAALFVIALVLAPVAMRFLGRPRYGESRARGVLLQRRDALELSLGAGFAVLVLIALVETVPLAIAGYHALTTRYLEVSAALTSTVASVSSLLGSVGASRLTQSPGGKRILGLTLAAVLGPLLPLAVLLYTADALVYRYSAGAAWVAGPGAFDLAAVPLLVWVALALWIALVALLDINITGLHGFYRDRLSGAFLIEPGAGGLASADDRRLSELAASESLAPYHILGATLNLQADPDPLLRGRDSDFFSFTKHHVGSPRSGYCDTRAMERVAPSLTLASAVAISGGAASPNMGTRTMSPLVMLMTLLNIRLGVWLPNPGRLAAELARRGAEAGTSPGLRARYRASVLWLVREMFGRIGKDGALVNVSDGGHIENTGAYELLRRRCKYVLMIDAGVDRGLDHISLSALLLYARVDLGIEIEIELDNVRLGEGDIARQHAALGVIRYPETPDHVAELGYLVYVKNSVTGDEDEVIREYRARSPAFPHESTADQFFDERQFEVYRALGEHMLDDLFAREHAADEPLQFAALGEWIQALRARLAPPSSAAAVGSGPLGAIESALATPELDDYRGQLIRGLGLLSEPTSPRVFSVVTSQLRLMQTVYNELGLDAIGPRRNPRNLGWINRFRRWSAAPDFRRVYAISGSTWSEGFQVFCEDALGLALEIRWSLASEQSSAGIRDTLPPAAQRALDEATAHDPGLPGSLYLVGHLQCVDASLDGLPPVAAVRVIYTRETGRTVLRESGLSPGYEGVYLYGKAYRALKAELPALIDARNRRPPRTGGPGSAFGDDDEHGETDPVDLVLAFGPDHGDPGDGEGDGDPPPPTHLELGAGDFHGGFPFLADARPVIDAGADDEHR